MTRIITLIITVLTIFSFAATSDALTYTFTPGDSDMDDLDHYWYYTWGIDFSLPAGEAVSEATLTFDNIRNWDDNPNDLYVHLLDTAAPGVIQEWDDQGFGDNFAGQGVLLEHWVNLPSTPQDIVYSFSMDQIGVLSTYLSDGNFGLGLDPDCHYWNDGVTLEIETVPTPEPSTMILLGSGLLGLGAYKRKFKKS